MDTSGSNPYPSPPSTLDSPNITEEPVTALSPSISRLATISALSEASRETQRHLQHTSAALDAAYSRIRQIRRSLLELSESLPATLFQLRASDGRRPISGYNDDTLSLPPGFQPAQELGRRGYAREMASRDRVQSDAHNNRISSDISTSEGFSHSLTDIPQQTDVAGTSNSSLSQGDLPPFTRMRVSPSRFTGEDDGSTILGRRVAARTTVAPTIADAVFSTNRLTGDAGQIYEGSLNAIAAVTRNYEEEIERVLRALNERRRISPTVPLRATPHRTSMPTRTLSQDPQLYPRRSSQGTPQSSSQAPPNPSSNFRGDPSPDTIPNSARQNPGSSERLSLLSNFSVQNSPTPSTSVLPSRPLLFNEPLSYVPSEMVDPSLESRYLLTSESAFRGRHYVVHRTRNQTGGQELVHNITVDWDEGEPMSWLMPSPNISRRHRNRFSSPRQTLDILRSTDPVATSPPPPLPVPENANGSTHPSNHPRRRGWARLDLDGNEIPSDEEEEVERVRTESRIRASQRAHALASVAQTANMTTPSAPPPRQLIIYQNIKPPVVLKHEPSLSYPADFVNPLPMPLSEMVDQGKNAERKATLLPRHTIVAGR